MTNLRKAIHYLQQSIRHEHPDDVDLLKALDILTNKSIQNSLSEIKPMSTKHLTSLPNTFESKISLNYGGGFTEEDIVKSIPKTSLLDDCGESGGCENCVCQSVCKVKTP